MVAFGCLTFFGCCSVICSVCWRFNITYNTACSFFVLVVVCQLRNIVCVAGCLLMHTNL